MWDDEAPTLGTTVSLKVQSYIVSRARIEEDAATLGEEFPRDPPVYRVTSDSATPNLYRAGAPGETFYLVDAEANRTMHTVPTSTGNVSNTKAHGTSSSRFPRCHRATFLQ